GFQISDSARDALDDNSDQFYALMEYHYTAEVGRYSAAGAIELAAGKAGQLAGKGLNALASRIGSFFKSAPKNSSNLSRYVHPGPGAAAKGEIFSHAWIKRDLFKELPKLVGKADANKFKAALKKGVVGPTGQSGVKILREPVNGLTHELKIGGSAQRILGRIDENGVLVFDKFIRGGLH
ncbi:MAG: hypothetical protein AAGK14_14730, partial [Verrucomicrobiota bacterium]